MSQQLIRTLLFNLALMLATAPAVCRAVDGSDSNGSQAETSPPPPAQDGTSAGDQLEQDLSPEAKQRRKLTEQHGAEVAEAILTGTVIDDMTIEQVMLARGAPNRKDVIPPDAELWHYDAGEVAFSAGKVSYVSLEPLARPIPNDSNAVHETQQQPQKEVESKDTSIAMTTGVADANTERALALSQARRRQIQAWLGALGFNPGPPDGAFGPGTRRSIEAWQRALGFPSSGYLNAVQLQQLESDGESPEAQEIYWQQIRATESVGVLEEFVSIYPNGTYVTMARNRIQALRTAIKQTPRPRQRAGKPPRRRGARSGPRRYSPKERRAIDKFNSL